jgi:hypothetical protein
MKYKVIIIMTSFLFNICCSSLSHINSSSSPNLVGNWQGTSEGELGGLILKADGKVDIFKKGESIKEEIIKNRGDLIYTVDESKTPKYLDIIIITNSGAEIGRLKMIFEYIDSKSIRVRTFFNENRPNDFLNCTEEDTIILNKIE